MEFFCKDCSESFYLSFYKSLYLWPVKCIKCDSQNVNYSYCGSLTIKNKIKKEEILNGNI